MWVKLWMLKHFDICGARWGFHFVNNQLNYVSFICSISINCTFQTYCIKKYIIINIENIHISYHKPKKWVFLVTYRVCKIKMERIPNTRKKIFKEHELTCSELAQRVRASSAGKGICCQGWWPALGPWNPRGERRELIPTSCPDLHVHGDTL